MSEHILLVDDNLSNVTLIQRMLVRSGYRVSTCNSGLGALEWLEHEIPDLILLDIMMPDIDGYEVLRRIRQNSNLPFIPIIYVSAKQSTEDTVTGLDLGADDYVTKPINRDELLARMRTLLRLKATQRALQREQSNLSLLYKVSQTLHQSLEIDTLLEQTLQIINDVLASSKSSVLLFDDDGNIWRKKLFRNQLSTEASNEAVQTVLRDGLAAHAINTGEVQIVADASTDPRWKTFPDDTNSVGSALAFPFFNNHTKKVAGVFIMIHPQKQYFNPDVHALVTSLAEQISISVTNASSYTRLREAEDSREAFIQMLTHDLRSPLAGMIGCFDALTTTNLDDDAKFFVELGFRAGAAQQRLIDDLLDVYKAEAGRLAIELIPTTLERIGLFVEEQLMASAVESQLQLVINMPSEPLILLDEPKMVRVLANLVSNGIKWTSAGGAITVEGDCDRTQNKIIMRVIDTGQGIASEDLPHIFDKFYQGNIKGKLRGTGLGLTFCQLAVQGHGGTIQAQSQKGHGTTIMIELPLKEAV